MELYKTITLSKNEMQKCIAFSEESAKSQQQIEFGQNDTKPRSIKEIARDNLIGKMAEVAVLRMLREKYGIHYPVNFDIYPRGEWDDCDLQIKTWSIDIKSTRSGKWLLFETSKLKMRQNQKNNNLPDEVIMCRTPWDRDNDKPQGSVELIGAISTYALLKNSNNKVLFLKKHDYIPNTESELQANNLAIRFEDINHDWDKIIDYMIKNSPPDISNLHIPD